MTNCSFFSQFGRSRSLPEGLEERVPGEGRALDAHRELDDALQRLEVAELDLGARRSSVVVGSSSIDIIPLKRRTSARTSSIDLPLTAWLIIDAELCEIEQP